MKKFIALVGLSTMSMLAFAGNWSGKLLDASCYDEHKKASSCYATSSTTSFALEAGNGKVYTFDAAGNNKAAEALKNRADRSTDPSKPMSKEISARVTGDEEGGKISVEDIELQ